MVAWPLIRMRTVLPSNFTNTSPTFGLRLMLPSVRYIELPSYSGNSIVPGATILTKPGMPERMLQSVYSPMAGDEEERRGLDHDAVVVPEIIAAAARGQAIGDPAAVEPVLQRPHSIVVERPPFGHWSNSSHCDQACRH
jgi:hypothetical protein